MTIISVVAILLPYNKQTIHLFQGATMSSQPQVLGVWEVRRVNLKKIYEEHAHLFQVTVPTFHNLLWQILINETMKGKTVAFTAAYVAEGLSLVIADSAGGYFPTGIFFKPEITYMVGNEAAEHISMQVFHITKDEAILRVMKSMATKIHNSSIKSRKGE
jgi:hypothetical protein